MYPYGYNPYIGGPNVVVNGMTSPSGTLFIGVTGMNNSSIFYTYAVMPESGKTAHNTLGNPIKEGVIDVNPWWEISNYTSTDLGLSAGISFGSLSLNDFINSAASVSATYRSIRSIDRTTGNLLESDTYTGSLA